jgi:uncharacterized phosphosugar-binding protein
MWNNYTSDMQNPGRMADRQAEARAQRLADEGRERGEQSVLLTDGVRRVVASGTSHAAALIVRTRAGGLAARHRAAQAAARLQHAHRPRLTHGHHRA